MLFRASFRSVGRGVPEVEMITYVVLTLLVSLECIGGTVVEEDGAKETIVCEADA